LIERVLLFSGAGVHFWNPDFLESPHDASRIPSRLTRGAQTAENQGSRSPKRLTLQSREHSLISLFILAAFPIWEAAGLSL
jgi:hypothetical protein